MKGWENPARRVQPLTQAEQKTLPSSQNKQWQSSKGNRLMTLNSVWFLLKRERGALCTELFLQLAPEEISVHRCSSTAPGTQDTWRLQCGSTPGAGGAGNCFMYRGSSCRAPWAGRLARVTGARLKVPETLSSKSYILISVSTTRAWGFWINSPQPCMEAKQSHSE